ncbi:hypothetical protein HPG69_005406, partial [Diceros bicornis minor]
QELLDWALLYHKKIVGHLENFNNKQLLDKTSENIQVDEKGKLMAARCKIFGCSSEIDPSSLAID